MENTNIGLSNITNLSSSSLLDISTRLAWNMTSNSTVIWTQLSTVFWNEMNTWNESKSDVLVNNQTINGTITTNNMNDTAFIACSVILLLELLAGVSTNVVLILTIYHSPSLKTPPNAHLVNICATNLCLCVCMVLSAISFFISRREELPGSWKRFFSISQTLLFVTCLAHYWCIFGSIGFYRSKTIQKPSMSLQIRKKVIAHSITASWILSTFLGILIISVFNKGEHAVSWNPFQSSITDIENNKIKQLNKDQIIIMYIMLVSLLLGLILVISSYFTIVRTLYNAKPACKNKVIPLHRSQSMSSDGNECGMNSGRRSYEPEDVPTVLAPFTISHGTSLMDNFVVHYQKRQQSLTLEEALALESLTAPAKKTSTNLSGRRTLEAMPSNASNTSTKSHYWEFSDISPGFELKRFQRMKNNFAMKNYSLRRDRLSLKAATKNTLVMVSTYLLCSLPLFVCCVPGVLDHMEGSKVTQILLACRLVFYMNAPAYPIWYLIFSKRVRKCLCRLYESLLVKLNLRR